VVAVVRAEHLDLVHAQLVVTGVGAARAARVAAAGRGQTAQGGDEDGELRNAGCHHGVSSSNGELAGGSSAIRRSADSCDGNWPVLALNERAAARVQPLPRAARRPESPHRFMLRGRLWIAAIAALAVVALLATWWFGDGADQ